MVSLKERDSWNRSTKALRKAKAQDVGGAKNNKVSRPGTAVELVPQGSDLGRNKGDVVIKHTQDQRPIQSGVGGEQTTAPKKRNKRLERKIKRAAFIAVMQENKLTTGSADDQDTSVVTESLGDVDMTSESGENEGSNGEKVKDQQPKKTLHPELAKLTNKEKRLLKQLQKKNQEEGVDLAAVASLKLSTPKDARAGGDPVVANDRKSKKHQADKSVTTTLSRAHVTPITIKETIKKEKQVASEVSKKQQQQLAKEKEKLLEVKKAA